MQWVVFSYSLPSKANSSARVAVWRRLRRLGAVSPTVGLHVLRRQDECIEAFQWLAQEVQQAQGGALILHVERFEGVSDAQLVEVFRRARAKAYAAVETQVARLERRITARASAKNRTRLREQLSKLRRQHAEIARIDFFDTPEGTLVASRLARLEQSLSPVDAPHQPVCRNCCIVSGQTLGYPTPTAYRPPRLYLADPPLHRPRRCDPLRTDPRAGRGRLCPRRAEPATSEADLKIARKGNTA